MEKKWRKNRTKPIKSWYSRETKKRNHQCQLCGVMLCIVCHLLSCSIAFVFGFVKEWRLAPFLTRSHSFHAIVCFCRLSVSPSFIISFDLTWKQKKKEKKQNMKIEVRKVHFAKNFHFNSISALIKDHTSNIFYECLWLSHNFNIIVINMCLLYLCIVTAKGYSMKRLFLQHAATRQVFSSYFL